MALKLNEAYPGRFNNPSPEYPQGSFKNRTTPTAEDGSYFEQQWANDHLAFLSSLLDGAGVDADGSVDQVGASQYYNALLQVIQDNSVDTVNAPVATIAAAGTINLTAGAPNTSQIAISGTGVTISGFTVSANRFFVVKMVGASNTLVNSASLITGTGANITAVAGDSFLIRSTAENTIEILCYTRFARFTMTSALPITGSTLFDFNGIPSWAKKITATIYNASLNGSSSMLWQLGSGSIQGTGYLSGSAAISVSAGNVTTPVNSVAGMCVHIAIPSYLVSGEITFTNIIGNTWVSHHTIGGNDVRVGGGTVTLSGQLDRLRLTTVNGTDSYDGPGALVMLTYEG